MPGSNGRKFNYVPIDIAVMQSGIHPYAKLVYALLCTFVDVRSENPTAWPSLSTMVQKTGLSRNTIRSALAALETEGIITKNRRTADAGDYDSNAYTLHDWRNPKPQNGRSPAAPPHEGGSPPGDPPVGHDVNYPIPVGGSPDDLPVGHDKDTINNQGNQAPNNEIDPKRIRLTRITIPELAAVGPCTVEARQIWESALTQLQLQVSKANFATWLKDTVVVGATDHAFYIGVPTTFAVDWLENRLHSLVKKTLTAERGNPTDVVFVTLSPE